MYRQFSREFQGKVQSLDQAARDRNVDRAALAWVDTTLNCVECHKWVNAMLIADLSLPEGTKWSAAVSYDEPADDRNPPDGPQRTRPEPADRELPEQRVSRFMREKLDSAQQVLEGVLVEDFELVTKGARRMAIMSQAAEWHVFDTATYREDSAEFRAKCRQLLKAADDERTDAAALSYLQLTLSCVRCHQHLRQNRVAAADPSRRTVHPVANR
jgi:hypothetical protein